MVRKFIINILIFIPLFAFGQNGFFFNQHTYSSIEIGDSVLVFQICNSNSVVDDNFDIYLNGVYIGFVDLNQNAQIGSIFFGTANESYVLVGDFSCPIVGMSKYYFDNSILIQGQNTIFMDNVQNNGAGNLGSIGIRHYAISATADSLINPRVIDDLEYSGASGLDFTLNFDYP